MAVVESVVDPAVEVAAPNFVVPLRGWVAEGRLMGAADEGCDFATSTSGVSPLTVIVSASVATPSVTSSAASAPTTSVTVRLTVANPCPCSSALTS